MNNKDLGYNYFTIQEVKPIKGDYYRVTISNDYVSTNDINIILSFLEIPKVGQRVEILMRNNNDW